ncbi:MAG: hypothetical protein QNL62_01720 [Gammaproteobacteria bacterium]|nr:hypothetical protein [Gammaproteobacteria bacterium]
MAFIDPIQEIISEDYPAALRWENIEGSPVRLSGEPIRYDFSKQLHVVRLKQHQQISIHLNQAETLRIMSLNGPVSKDLLSVEASNGSSLYSSVIPLKDQQQKNLLIEANNAYSRIIKITSMTGNDLILSLFVSRQDYIKRLSPYRDLLQLPLESIKLLDVYKREATEYWFLDKLQPLSLQVTGPKRIALKLRLKYHRDFHYGRQKFQLDYSLDNETAKKIYLAARQDALKYYTVDNKNVSVAHEETVYIDVPEGDHTLRVNSFETVYIRLLGLDEPDYLFPNLNATQTSVLQAKAYFAENGVDNDEIFTLLLNEQFDNKLYNTQWISEFIAINNEVRDSALDAIRLLENSTRNSRGLKGANNFAEQFRSQHTFYRNLLPYNNSSGQDNSIRRFILYPLRQWNKTPDPHYMVKPHYSTLCESLKRGYFFTLPDNSRQALTYTLGERVHATRLRVIVDKHSLAGQETFYLQYDENKPVRYRVSPESELPISYFDASTSEACVSRSYHAKNVQQYYPIDMGFGLTNAAFLEVTLPVGVKTIKVWKTLPSSNSSGSLLKVALQYQAAKAYEIPQQDYINLIDQLNDSLRSDFLLPVIDSREIKSTRLSKQLSQQQLYRLTQGWQALKMFLLSRKQLFSAGYIKPEIKTNRAYSDNKTINSIYRQIQVKREQQQWLEIIELFSSLRVNAQHRLYVKLHKQFYYALQQTGENNLRERLLRGALLYDDNEELKHSVFELLKTYYQSHNFDAKLTQLLVNRAFSVQTDAVFKQLVLHLVSQGHNEFALLLGLTLKQDDYLNEKLLQASLNEKKWLYYDYLLDRISPPSKQIIWKALKALSLGDKQSVNVYLSQLDDKKHHHAELIKQVLSLHETSVNSNPELFVKKWSQWSHWKLDNSDASSWQDNTDIISHSEGAVSLYNQERNLLKNYFRSSRNHPVKLTVIGPARLRFGIRLLYKDLDEAHKKTMLILKDNNRKMISSPINSVPSQGLMINELENSVVGSIQYFEYAVGDGEHHIEYYADDYPLITSVSTLQPSIRVLSLPDILTPALLDFIVSRPGNSKTTIAKQSYRQCLNAGCMLLFDNSQQQRIPRIQVVNKVLKKALKKATSFTNAASFSEAAHDDFYPLKTLDRNYFQMQFEKLCLFDDATKKLPVIIEPLDSLSKNTLAVKTQCYQDAQKSEQAIMLLSQMYWYLHRDPDSQSLIDIWAGSILQKFSNNPEVYKFYSLFEQKSKWAVQSSVTESAGIRFYDVRGWQPISAHARIRKALLEQQDDSIILNDDSISGISLSNHIDSTLKVTIKNQGLPFFPRQDLLLRYQLDTLGWKYISVKLPQDEQQLTVSVPLGTHTFKIQWLNPLIGQYVSVNLVNIKYQQGKKLYNESERYFHIATQNEPVKIAINGPARLKIDYKLDENYEFEYLYIADGWYKITLPAWKNKQSVLYRIYQRVNEDSLTRPDYPALIRQVTSLPFSKWYKEIDNDIMEKQANAPVSLVDNYTLGKQEDGTFAFGVLWSQGEDREDNINDLDINDYYEYNISHYYFHEEWRTYFDSTLLYRDHDAGEPTYGFKETIFMEPDWLPFAFRFNWNYYTQRYYSPKDMKKAWSLYKKEGLEEALTQYPEFNKIFNNLLNVFGRDKAIDAWSLYNSDGIDQVFNQYPDMRSFVEEYDLPKANDTAWSSNVRLGIEQLYQINPKLSHLPKLTVFNNAFGNNGFIPFVQTDIDYDVWNEYADIHDKGLILSDTFYAYPWLDTRISSGFSLYSDEDYRLHKPEHFSYNMGWLQMLDKFILNMDYRWTHYYSEHNHDWNRSSSSSKAVFNTNLFWESWTSPTNRLLTNVKLSYDTKKHDVSATVGFSYYFDHGRGFRDFRPHSMSFRDLRERHRYWDNNNSILNKTE